MKYLKKFNELKSSTYSAAANRLNQMGHKLRGSKMGEYAQDTKKKEDLKSFLDRNFKSPFLNHPDSKLEGFAYRWDQNKKVWQNLGLTTAKISYLGLNTDLMCDDNFESVWSPILKLYVGFQIDLDPFKEVIGIEKFYTYELPIFEHFSGDIELGISQYDFSKSYSNEYFSADYLIAILLNRKGLRSLNKMIKNYLTDGFGQKVKWWGKSEGNFMDSELYSVPDYLYNYFDLLLTKHMEKNPEGVTDQMRDYNDNFDDYYREMMEKLKAPKVYYRIYRDEFPAEIKNINLE